MSQKPALLLFSNEYVRQIQRVGDSEAVIYSKPGIKIPSTIFRIANKFLTSRRLENIATPKGWMFNIRFDCQNDGLHRMILFPDEALLKTVPTQEPDPLVN